MAKINLQSINRKASFVHDIISENNLSFLPATELRHTTSLDITLLYTLRFTRFQRHRSTSQDLSIPPRRGRRELYPGGVGIFYSDRFSGKRLNLGFSPTTFEVLACSLCSSSIIFTDPGGGRFFDEITTLLEFVATFQSQVVISGDFNIHVRRPEWPTRTPPACSRFHFILYHIYISYLYIISYHCIYQI